MVVGVGVGMGVGVGVGVGVCGYRFRFVRASCSDGVQTWMYSFVAVWCSLLQCVAVCRTSMDTLDRRMPHVALGLATHTTHTYATHTTHTYATHTTHTYATRHMYP